MEHSEIDKLDKAFHDGKYVIVQTAPAVRAAIGEEFGEPIGTNSTGKMVAALHRLGFYRVFDTNFAADLTITEEASEFIQRIISHIHHVLQVGLIILSTITLNYYHIFQAVNLHMK